MIARRVVPDASPQVTFVPLHLDHHRGEWVPIEDPGVPMTTEIAAARACAAALQREWSTVAGKVQVVHALCEHPAFQLQGDGLAAATVRDAVRDLSGLVDQLDAHVARLLDPPGARDIIRIGSVIFRQSEQFERIEPAPDEPSAATPDPARDWERRLRACFDSLVLADPSVPTPEAAQRMITWLRALAPHAPEGAGGVVADPVEDIATRPFQRVPAEPAPHADGTTEPEPPRPDDGDRLVDTGTHRQP